ncbi:MAG: isoleucine--tRNA ligase [Phycisphaerales bacterium]|nr:isoleucine--tRNA ligase [Phycisphaerales bacterium]
MSQAAAQQEGGKGSGASAEKSRYRQTLNLPKTSFPMKANLVQNEPASLKRWDGAKLYEQVTGDATRTEPFVFHDGPPYANASLHLGHMLNKTLKDFVFRSALMEGKKTSYVPGWDCHGLPIEHKVMQELAQGGKLQKLATLDDDTRRMAIRRECQKHAEKWSKHQAGQMQRLLTLADYAHPYLTMLPAYEGAVIEVFAGLVEQGLVYRQLKAVHWSIANETALAEAELEYEDREDISVYVDFEAADAQAVYEAFGLSPDEAPGQRPSFMIWTTTPWTLPANLAIAINPRFEYALVRVDGNVTVLAAELVEQVTKAAKADQVEVLAKTSGQKLLGLRYNHPFVENLGGTPGPDFSNAPDAAVRHADPMGVYRIVEAEYVRLEDGTGLVHTAPGHGADDYHTGLKEKLPIYCPVRENGTYDESVPEWLRGMSVWDANEAVVKSLRESGHLFCDHRFMHSYPHDWRSKTPVIFRATEQWFVAVDEGTKREGKTLREMAMSATERGVRFIPEWGRNRMRGMLESRPDWCISRQRSWGLPIPAFYTADGEVVLTASSVRAIAKRFREKGSDAWFTEDPPTLLQHWDNPDGVELQSLRKGQDIFDVWFESGSSWNAVMRERSGGRDFPIDLYLEGSDQHRGWFQLSLLPGLGVMGEPPFKSVLTHGFMVDKDGRKMSKSGGNALDVDELVKTFGADVCRWWIGTISYENDIKADLDFFKTAGEAYRKVRNTLRFMLSNLDDFTACSSSQPDGQCVSLKDFGVTSIDAWVLGAFDKLSKDVRAAYAAYHFQKATSLLYNFCNDTLSAIYLAAVKDRLYCDKVDSARRRRTQTTLWDLTDGLCRLLAPVMPHTADEAWRALHRLDAKDPKSVHGERFPGAFGVQVDAAWAHVLEQRDDALQELERVRAQGALENPLDAGMKWPDADGKLKGFDPVDLADLLGVSKVTLTTSGGFEVVDLRDEPRCERSWKRDGTVKARSDGGMLSDRDAEAVGV